MHNYGPGRCKQCGDDSSGWICIGCEASERLRGRAWAEGVAQVLRKLIAENGAPKSDNPFVQSFIDTLEKKP
jgi:hypothetical protein